MNATETPVETKPNATPNAAAPAVIRNDDPDALEAIFAEIGPAEGYRVTVDKVTGAGDEYCADYSPEEFSKARIQQDHGGGTFKVTVRRTGGQFVKRATIRVAARANTPRQLPPPEPAVRSAEVPAPRADMNFELFRLMLQMQQASNEQTTKILIAMMEKRDGGALSAKDIIELTRAGKDKGSLVEALEALEKLQSMAPVNSGGEGGSDMAAIAQAASAFAPLIQQFMARNNQPLPAPRPVTAPPRLALPTSPSSQTTRADVVAKIGPTATREGESGSATTTAPTPSASGQQTADGGGSGNAAPMPRIDPASGLMVPPYPLDAIVLTLRDGMRAKIAPTEVAEALAEIFNDYDEKYENDPAPPLGMPSLWDQLQESAPGAFARDAVPFLGQEAEPFLAWLADVETALRATPDDDQPPAAVVDAIEGNGMADQLAQEVRRIESMPDDDPQTGGPGAQVDDDGMPRAGNPATKPHKKPKPPRA